MAMLWRSGIAKSTQFSNQERVATVRFEDFVRTPQIVLEEMCDDFDISFEEQMLNVPIVSSSNRPNQSGTGIDPWVADRWKEGGLTKAELYICEKLCAKEMQAHKYEAIGERPNPFALAYSAITFVFKTILAVLFNLGRVNGWIPAFKRRFLSK